LVDATYEAMWRGIPRRAARAHLGDIGSTIQKFAEGPRLLRPSASSAGHGSAGQFHEEPQVLHYGRPGTGLTLVPE